MDGQILKKIPFSWISLDKEKIGKKELSLIGTLMSGFKVRDKITANLIPFDLTDDFSWAQRVLVEQVELQIRAGKPVRIIVLKARQLGMSTATAGVVLVLSLIWKGTASLIVTHDAKITKGLFARTKTMWDNWSLKDAYKLRYNTMNRMVWEHDSEIDTATAKNLGSGRGSTTHILHGSEVAFWPDPEALVRGLKNSIPESSRSAIILESTANGVGGYWYGLWGDACDPEMDVEYTPMFFSPVHHPEYRRDASHITVDDLDEEEIEILQKYSKDAFDWDNIPVYYQWMTPTWADQLHWADFEFISWRRWAIVNKCNGDIESFHQEYPLTPDEAFISSGSNVFPIIHVNQSYESLPVYKGRTLPDGHGGYEYHADPSGPLRLYAAPTSGQHYIIGIDPAYQGRGDPAVAQVLNRETLEQVCVYEYMIDAASLAVPMRELALYYNNALVTCEVEGPGQATILVLANTYGNVFRHKTFDRPYQNSKASPFGWSASYARKFGSIELLTRCLVDGSITIHDRRTVDQLRDYTYLGGYEAGNADPSGHDDCVTALCQALAVSHLDGFDLFREKDDRASAIYALLRTREFESARKILAKYDELGYNIDEDLVEGYAEIGIRE